MPVASRSEPYFTPATFKFLRSLARNNRRDWFQAHKPQYEETVKAPSLRLIADLAAPLRAISPQLVADPRPVGGSLFRIHRDTRFSANKAPYKTHVGMTFFHAATHGLARGLAGTAAPGRLDAPVLYLHVEPGACFAGGGLWHPQAPTLKRIRDFMVDNPRSWTRLTTARAFRNHFALTGDSLVRPPQGYPAGHFLIEDLKRKDFVAMAALADADVTGPDLRALLLRRFRLMRPMLEWLCMAVQLEF
jgi:uncharacterized protein (TIGR02453 family)